MTTQGLLGGVQAMPAEQMQYFNMQLLDRLNPRLVHGAFGRKQNIPANGGVSMNFRRFERIAASTTALVEGTPPANVVATITSIGVTIAQYGQIIQGSDLLLDQSIDQVLMEFTKMLAEAAAISIDTIDRDILVAGSVVQYASTATTRATVGSGMRMTTAELLEAKNTLERVDAKGIPEVDNLFAVIAHPDTISDLFNDSTYTNAQLYAGARDGSNSLVRGTLNDYHGMRWFPTSNARVFTSLGLSGADVYATLIVGDDAYATTQLDSQQLRTIYKAPGSSGIIDPLDQTWTLGYKVAHATIITNQSKMVRIEHTTVRGTGG